MSELRRADAALTEQDKTDIRRDLGLGTAAVANVPASGNAASGEVVKGNDTRLSDPRTPTTHSHTAAQVTDFAAAADARIAAASVNALADIDVTSPSVGQVLKWNGAAWVNDTDDTAAVGGATNLSYTPSPTGGTVHSDTGADATVPLSDGTNAGLLAPAQHAKLAGVAANATANSSDATLLARANHTGTQAASTISDFSAAADARISAAVSVTVASAAQGTDAREWTAATVDQAEAEAGAATTRRAWTAQRVAQAIAAQVATWWTSISTAAGRALVTAADAAAQRTALGLGSAATTAASAYATEAQGTKADGAAQIAGDLGGTAAAPVVSKVNGVAISGTPTAGQVPTATSGTAATWQTPSGGGLPTGVSSPGDGALDFATGSITTSRPSINITQTWNAGAVAFTGLRMNITKTAAAANSLLIDLQKGGSSLLSVREDGLLGFTAALSAHHYLSVGLTEFSDTTRLCWSSSSVPYGLADVGFSRNAAGIIEINSSTAGTYRDLKLRNLIATEGTQLTALTVGTLPAAASNTWKSCAVSDANAPTVGATVASGGSAKAVVRSNGTNWIVTEVI